MGVRCKFDTEKGIEVILYIAERVPDMYTALKVLYFADKKHLSEYGRLICGDRYVAMHHGPVPSGVYDLVKLARGDGFCWVEFPITDFFTVQENAITPRRKANRKLLSDSEIKCLDFAIDLYGHRSFGDLRKLSHDAAFEASDENDFIPLDAIAKTLSNGDLLLDYLHSR